MKFEKNSNVVKECKGQLANSPELAHKVALSLITDPNKEHFIVIHLNTRNIVISAELVSLGTLNASIVHPREVFYTAITSHCANIVLAHNHPSGDLEPSEEDIRTTKRLQEAGQMLGVQVNDHIIFSGEEYKSFRESGLI